MSQIRVDKNIEKAIYDFFNAVLESDFGPGTIPVMWDKQIADSRNNQSPKRPNSPFFTLNISTPPMKEGNAEIIYKGLDTFSFPFRKAFTVSGNIYSPAEFDTPLGKRGYFNVIESVTNAIELESFRSILRQAGISAREVSAPVDLSELLESVFEFRSSVDFFMAYSKVVDDVIGQIDKVNVKGTVEGFEIIQNIPEN